MTLLLPEPPPVSAAYSDDQLHCKACVACGLPGSLVPAGHVTVDIGRGDQLAWAVAAHPEHLGGRS